MHNQQTPNNSVRNQTREEQSKLSKGAGGLDHGIQSLVAKDSPDDPQLGAPKTDASNGKAP